MVLDEESIVVLNVGTTASTVVVDSSIEVSQTAEHELARPPGELGPGDREFLSLAEKELSGEAQEAAIGLLRQVRSKWPGDLKRGERNEFSNTPDNSWDVLVQPRAQTLSITLRGAPERFQSKSLNLKTDRPGYIRFTVGTPDELPEVIRLIEQSKRK